MIRALPLSLVLLGLAGSAAQAAPKATLALVDARTGDVRVVREAPRVTYTDLRWSADGKHAYALRRRTGTNRIDVVDIDPVKGGSDSYVKVPDAENCSLGPTGLPVIACAGIEDGVRNLAVFDISTDGAVRHPLARRARSIAWSDDGTRLAVAESDRIVIFDAATLAELRTVPARSPRLRDDAWSGGTVTFGTRRVDAGTGKVTDAPVPLVRALATALSPTGRILAYGRGGTVRVRSIRTGRSSPLATVGGGDVTAIAYAPNGRRLLASVSP